MSAWEGASLLRPADDYRVLISGSAATSNGMSNVGSSNLGAFTRSVKHCSVLLPALDDASWRAQPPAGIL